MQHRFFPFLLSLLLLSACSYLPDAPLAPVAPGYEETADYIKLPAPAAEAALVFIPGGLVDPHAYVPLMQRVAAEAGVTVFILKVEANLAILSLGQAGKLRKREAAYATWYVGGHSLGGVAAQAAVSRDPGAFAGVVFLGVYPAEGYSLAGWGGPVLSLYAENDLLSTVVEVEGKVGFLPPAYPLPDITALDTLAVRPPLTFYHLIEGGNHGQFGSYGFQEGDGVATISREAQHARVSEAITRFIQWCERL